MKALNSTAVNVSWTPVTLLDTEYHYTVHYITVCGIVNVSYPASASSGVVPGLQELQYQFIVTVTIISKGKIYSGGEANLESTTRSNVSPLETSIASISLVQSTHPLSTSVLIVIGVLLLVAFTGNIISSVYNTFVLKRHLHTFKR